MLFVFLRMFCAWLFLFFDLIFSITLPPVQTHNPIGRNVPNLQFWVSFLLKDTGCFEKAKDCLFRWFVSFFKFCFLIIFGLHLLHQVGNNFLCKLIFVSPIWGFILCKESFRARNRRDLQLCFTFFRIRTCFLKLRVFFLQRGCQPTFFLKCYYKTGLWVGSLHWKPTLLQFSPDMCRIVFSRNYSLVSKTCIFFPSFKVSANKISLATICLKNKLSASAL